MNIDLETVGNTFFEHQTTICFSFDGDEYWFDMVEKGDKENAPENITVDFVSDEELPFELTEEMKDEMYRLASTH